MAKTSKYSFKERVNFEEIYNAFLGMAHSERTIALVGIAFVLCLIVLLPVSCASSKISKKEKVILNHQKNMGELATKLKEYQGISNRMKALKSQWTGRSAVSLRSTLDMISTQSGLDRNNVESINEQQVSSSPSDVFEEHVATVRLTKVPLGQLVDFLYKVENHSQGSLKVKKIQQMRPRYDNRQLFDLSVDVSTYALKEKEKEKEGAGK